MYYPYLRGKQFELLALRDFAKLISSKGRVFPIVEPVRRSFRGIQLALPALHGAAIPLAVVLNPQVGELEGDAEFVLKELGPELSGCTPAFIINRNVAEIRRQIERHGLRQVMLIRLPSAVDTDEEIEQLVSMDAVKALLVGDRFKSLRRKMKGLNKEVVMFSDYFAPLGKNSDYVGVPEEMFSEDYWYYHEEGYQGISDYTVLPSSFQEGGRLPYAIAIHLTCVREKRVFVEHFVSDSNSDTSNIQGKFAEAANKALTFFNNPAEDSAALGMLRDYVRREEYPGLGMLKKISILHHMELVSKILEAER